MPTIYHIIFLSLVFLLPLKNLKQIYSFDRGEYRVAKVLNLFVTIVIIYLMIGGNSVYQMVTDFSEFKKNYYIDAGIIPSEINLINKIFSSIGSIYVFVLVIRLSRRIKKARKIFVYLLPLIAISNAIETNRYAFISTAYEFAMEETFVIVFVSIWAIFKSLILFIIYNSKSFKNMMFFDYKMIKNLYFGNAQQAV